jgi:hypothetical protein
MNKKLFLFLFLFYSTAALSENINGKQYYIPGAYKNIEKQEFLSERDIEIEAIKRRYKNSPRSFLRGMRALNETVPPCVFDYYANQHKEECKEFRKSTRGEYDDIYFALIFLGIIFLWIFVHFFLEKTITFFIRKTKNFIKFIKKTFNAIVKNAQKLFLKESFNKICLAIITICIILITLKFLF